LFGLGLLVYALVSLALPLVAGRDFPTYVTTWVQLDQWDSVLPMTMLYRPPIAPLVAIGPRDAVFAAGFAGWALLVARAVERPTWGRFVLVGLGVAALALTRPGNQVLLL